MELTINGNKFIPFKTDKHYKHGDFDKSKHLFSIMENSDKFVDLSNCKVSDFIIGGNINNELIMMVNINREISWAYFYVSLNELIELSKLGNIKAIYYIPGMYEPFSKEPMSICINSAVDGYKVTVFHD